MSDNHYDPLETRDPAQRELAQFTLLPDLVRASRWPRRRAGPRS